MYQDAAVIALIATVRNERKLSGSHVPCADKAAFGELGMKVCYTQTMRLITVGFPSHQHFSIQSYQLHL